MPCQPPTGVRILSGLRIAGHELKITADACTQRRKIEFTDSRGQFGGVIAHVKAPLRIRGKMNNLEFNPERFADGFQDLQQRNTRAGRDVERPGSLTRDKAFDHLTKIWSKNVIPEQLAIAVNIGLSLFPDARD